MRLLATPPSPQTLNTSRNPALPDQWRPVAVLFVALLATTAVYGASAAPHRHHQAVAPQTRDTDTSTTATIPSKTPAKTIPDPTARDTDVLPTPFHLPTASRQRMRDCGLKWQAMKASGEAGEAIWRDFATRCLAAASGPFDKRSER